MLDQIDPGPFEERLVRDLEGSTADDAFPPEYWVNWARECALADRIVVNSGWSKKALVGEGIDADKIAILPLVYDGPNERRAVRVYPARFTGARPLKLLFLGQVIARKGVLPLFEAMVALRDRPIELDIVGRVGMTLPPAALDHPKIRFHGSIPHSQAGDFYDAADVFILPTYSDGFAVTQVEARFQHLPVIASRFCGDVVDDGVNGLLLDAVTTPAIVDALTRCLDDPGALSRMSAVIDHIPSEAEMGRRWREVIA